MEGNLDVCVKCYYREGEYCRFDPSRSTTTPACNYTFPAIRYVQMKIPGVEA